MTSSRVPTSAAVLFALLLAAPVAFADQKSDLYAQGVAAYNSGDSILARQKFCQLAGIDASYKPDDKTQPDATAQCTEAKAAEQRTLNRYRNNYGEGVTLMGDGKLDEAAAKFRLVKAGDYADQAKKQLQQIDKLKADRAATDQQNQAAETANKQKLESGTNAFLAGRMDEAKSTLGGVTGSHQAEAQAVLTKIANYQAAVAKGRVFESTKEFGKAKDAYAEAVNINPAGPATDLLKAAATAANAPVPNNAANNPPPNIVKPPVAKPQIDIAAYLADAQKAVAKKDYKKARRYLADIFTQDRNNQDAKDILADVNSKDTGVAQASDEDGLLLDIVKTYYAGSYQDAEDRLKVYIYNNQGKKKGLANFYLGASMLTRYYLAGGADQNLKREAQNKFKAAKDVDGFKAPEKFVSPKIMKAFEEAS